MAHNKVMIGNTVIMDITDTTATVDKVLPGYYYYDKNGDKVEGTCPFNADTSEDDVASNYVKSGVTFHDATGTATTGNVTWNDTQTTVTLGSAMPSAQAAAYYNGITYTLDSSVINKDVIASGSTILGIQGEYEGEETVETGKYIQASTDYTGSGTRYDLVTPTSPNTAFRNVKVGKIWYQDSSTTGTTGETANIISLTES